jgi:MYXO-CTERM domain-containing protein
MKKALLCCALAGAISTAQAGTFIIDDFNTGDQSLTNSIIGSTVSDDNGIRTLSTTLTAGSLPIRSEAIVSNDHLDIMNGVGENSVVSVLWNLAPISLPANITNLSFIFEIIDSDGNPTNVSIKLNGGTVFNTAIPANTSGQLTSVPIAAALISGGGTFELLISGAAGWDMSIDAFGISWTDPTPNIPEPASAPLAALGLATLAALRKRKS